MSKKTTYLILLIVIVIIAIAIYIGQSKAGKAVAKNGKDITIALEGTVTTLDPQDATVTLDMSIAKTTYQSLYKFDVNMKPVPSLATGLKMSKDAKIYTVTLKKNIKFADGTDFNADAVKINLERQMNHNLKRHSLVVNIDKVEVVDPYTVKITLKKPFNSFLNTLASPSEVMISPAALAKYKDKISEHPVGTGQFMFKEWIHGDHVTFVPNPLYNGPKTNVASITYKSVPETGSRVSMITSGQAQWTFISPELLPKIENKKNLQVVKTPTIIAVYYTFNMLAPTFKDKRVRQALNYAVDKNAFVDIVYQGLAVPAKSVFPKAIETFKEQPAYTYNVAKAKQLLKEAGYPNGFSVDIWIKNNSTSLRSGQFLQQQLAQIGVKANLIPRDVASHYALAKDIKETAPKKNILVQAGWSSSLATADWALRPLFTEEGTSNFGNYYNTEVNDKIHKAMTVINPDDKIKIYQDLQAKIWADVPYIFGITETMITAHDKKLQGFTFLPDESFSIDNLQYK